MTLPLTLDSAGRSDHGKALTTSEKAGLFQSFHRGSWSIRSFSARSFDKTGKTESGVFVKNENLVKLAGGCVRFSSA
jgi:hypothetical protein